MALLAVQVVVSVKTNRFQIISSHGLLRWQRHKISPSLNGKDRRLVTWPSITICPYEWIL